MRRLAILIIAAATPAAAKTTFLACTMATAEGSLRFGVTPDPSARAVTYDAPATGYSARRPAIFSAAKITFTIPLTFGAATFEISRSDLAATRTIAVSGVPQTDHGNCTLQTVPKPAF